MSKVYNTALQERVSKFMETTGISQNRLADEVGVSVTALSYWRRSNYNGDPQTVESKLMEYFDTYEARQALKEQAAAYKPTSGYVPTSISQDVYSGIRFAQVERGMVILHGDAGIGKTEAAKKFRADFPHTAILITVTPSSGTLGGVIRLLAAALGVSGPRSRMDQLLAIRKKLAGTNKVIIVDEAQHLRISALEELRALTDADSTTGEPGTGVCLIGNTEVYDRMMGRQQAQFAQLYSRIRMQRVYSTRNITRQDIEALFPRLTEDEMNKELDFLLSVAKGRWGIRGAVTVYNNSIRNEDVSIKGLYSMATHLGVGFN